MSGPRPERSIFCFAATTLLGAFLVFQVQPVISKCVLPWFGGTPAVWTTCMLFFQVLLFGGYLYAHLLRTWFRPAIQGSLHLLVLGSAAMMLPIEPSDAWKPSGDESPTLYLMWLLAAHVGLPYFVLSSTGPLVQAWFSYQDNSDRVYRLYALSNAGSLFALLSYPFVVEPVLSVSDQSVVWSLMFCLFVLIQGFVAISLFRVTAPALDSRRDDNNDIPANSQEPSWATIAAWVALPAFASSMLLIVTNHVCQDVAVVPFLWVLPLSLYLISFIVCFDSPQWYRPKLTATVTIAAIALIHFRASLPLNMQLVLVVTSFMVVLLGVCLMCHGEVARLKPRADRLTLYYALLSLGGALGGMLVAVVCPLLFNSFAELPFSLIAVQVMTLVLFMACKGWRTTQYDWNAAYRLRYVAGILIIAPTLVMAWQVDKSTVVSDRNFFGVLRVQEVNGGLRLVHGTTIHGMQFGGERSRLATTYYHQGSGVGLTLLEMQKRHSSLRIGVIGLGCGVLACYGRAEDEFDAVEINPGVVDIARENFTFLKDCPCPVNVHLGDGRLVLERMTDKKFDVLVLDAFSSDAIPAHLLTREAFTLYQTRLADAGVLAFHVSNTHLDLAPLVHRLSHEAGLESRLMSTEANDSVGANKANWMIVAAPNHELFSSESLKMGQAATAKQLADAPLWTDQHHNLLSVMRFW
jgi:spermidine synthase